MISGRTKQNLRSLKRPLVEEMCWKGRYRQPAFLPLEDPLHVAERTTFSVLVRFNRIALRRADAQLPQLSAEFR